MIRVPRGQPEPAALQRTDRQGRTELQKVLAAVEDRLDAAGIDPQHAPADDIVAALESFDFDYARYREPDVKTALTSMFHGKCAYCESFYANTQPMDVEHFRPKGGIRDEQTGDLLKPGYYWLASAWLNLLPSCIDCNRSRVHEDDGGAVTSGKANLFPVAAGSPRLRWHGADPSGDASAEEPLILNPCIDEPSEHLDFRADGVVLPRSPRGEKSIEVFGLNRPSLVVDRRHVARIIEFRVDLIGRLGQLRDRMRDHDPDLLLIVEEMISFVLQELRGMTASDRPYAGMAGQLIAELQPDDT